MEQESETTTSPEASSDEPLSDTESNVMAARSGQGASSHHRITDLQNRLANSLGIRPEGRQSTVQAIFERSTRERAGYWLQLVLAMGIATLGLVLGSTAVVIGAMLISPLMGPIVELGMGLAIGSPFLVIRSAIRTASSVVLVILCAALLTLALPFREVTSEIAARTSPTALDLLIAVFCALAAAYTTVRPGSDTTATAAGTAIGIALVPPLCVVGYGIGTGNRQISGGAALLFTANFCAILLFAVLCFLLLGYGMVGVAELERAEIERTQKGALPRTVRALQFIFGMKYGPLLRVLMPLVLVGAVYFPLRDALRQVTWQVRVRKAIQEMLDTLPQDAVRSSVTVEPHGVAVRLVTLGRTEDAQRIEQDLRAQIAAAAGIVPVVEVIAVPDAATLKQLADAMKPREVPVEVVRKEPDPGLLRERLGGALDQIWPKEAGALLKWRIELPVDGSVLLEVVHSGPELGAAGAALLGGNLSRTLGAKVTVRDIAISLEPLVADREDGLAWFPRALLLLERLGDAGVLHGCIEVPAREKKPRNGNGKAKSKDDGAEMVALALRSLREARKERIRITEGNRWMLTLSSSPCAEAADTLQPAGPSGGGESMPASLTQQPPSSGP